MLFSMDTKTACEFAAVADAASTEGARPLLCQVEVEIDHDIEEGTATLRVVATDTYILANREVTFGAGNFDSDSDDINLIAAQHKSGGDGILVNAKDWKKALVEAAKGANITGAVLIEVRKGGVSIVRDTPSAVEVSIMKFIGDGGFPKWRTLMGSQADNMDLGGPLPAFDPTKLGTIQKLVTTRVSERHVFPVRLHVTDQKGTDMKPWLFIQTHGESRLEVLLMPVRV